MPAVKNEALYLVALGSNLGDRAFFLDEATRAIGGAIGPIVAIASRYETAPVGAADRLFLNSALIVRTEFDPDAVMAKLLEIEATLGRVRRETWGNRVIDLDILLCRPFEGSDVCRSYQSVSVTLPHPRMMDRDFVLVPAAEIAGTWRPGEGEVSLTDALAERRFSLASLQT